MSTRGATARTVPATSSTPSPVTPPARMTQSRSAPSSPPTKPQQTTQPVESIATLALDSMTLPPPSQPTTMTVSYTSEWGVFVGTLAGVPPPPLVPVVASVPSKIDSESPLSPTSAVAAFNAKQAEKPNDDDDEEDDEEDEDDEESQRIPTPLNETQFFHPVGICPSRDEKHLLVCDSHALRHINTVKRVVGILSGVVRGAGIFRDHRGQIWIADTEANCIRIITRKGELQHVAGSTKGAAGFLDGPGTAARFNGPTCVCSNGGDWTATAATSSTSSAATTAADAKPTIPLLFFVCDPGNCAVRIVTEKGVVTTLAGAPPELLLIGTSHINQSSSSANAPKGKLPHLVPRPPPKLASPPIPGGPVVTDGLVSAASFLSPTACAFDHADQSLIVVDSAAHNVRKISREGLVWTIAGGTQGKPGFRDAVSFRARFNTPSGICIDSCSRIFISDRHNHAVRVLTPSGFVHTVAGTGHPGLSNGGGHQARLNSPTGLTLDASGTLYIVDSGNGLIRRLQFISLPMLPRELGDSQTVMLKEWYEFQDRNQVKLKQQEIRIIKLERQLLEQRKEYHELKKSTADEFAKVRAEQMQIMHQLMTSMQHIVK